MAPTLQELGIDRLTLEDRLAVADAIYEIVADEMETLPVSNGQRAELEWRLADSLARPDAVTPWAEVKAQLLARTSW
jgi:putative addiction module component (TIGR02574 family)